MNTMSTLGRVSVIVIVIVIVIVSVIPGAYLVYIHIVLYDSRVLSINVCIYI